MLDAKAFGKAAAAVTALVYIACVILVAIAPDLAFNLFTLSFHGVNTEVLRPVAVNLDIIRVVSGLVVTTVWVGVIFYLGGYFYNQFRKK